MKKRIFAVVRPVVSIQLYEADTVKMYCVMGHTKARMLHLDGPHELEEVPATAKCESTYADGLYTHTITYRIGQPEAELLEEYIRLSLIPAVVVFRNRSGRRMTIGSPSYPARLGVVDTGSGAQVTITAASRYPVLVYMR